jgi:hypothetical protein
MKLKIVVKVLLLEIIRELTYAAFRILRSRTCEDSSQDDD